MNVPDQRHPDVMSQELSSAELKIAHWLEPCSGGSEFKCKLIYQKIKIGKWDQNRKQAPGSQSGSQYFKLHLL